MLGLADGSSMCCNPNPAVDMDEEAGCPVEDTMDLLWNVDRPNRHITVRIRTGTTIQMVRLRFPQMVETAPTSEWIAAGCRLLASALDALPSGNVTDLPAELVGH